MLDKIGVLIIVVCILSGLVAYDRYYVSVKGEVSPVGKVLDYTGFTKIFPKINPVKMTKRSFGASFEDLQAKVREIEEKRLEYARHRQELLSQLRNANDKLRQEVGVTLKTLEEEKKKVLSHAKEMQKESARLTREIAVNGTIPENLLSDQFKNLVEDPQMQLNDVSQSSQGLDHEYQIFSENAAATEQQFQNGDENTVSSARESIQKLVQASETDLQDIRRLYAELWDIQKLLAENLDMNFKRMQNIKEETESKIRESIIPIKQTDSAVFAELSAKLDDWDHQSDRLFLELAQNELALRNTLAENWKEQNKFFNYYVDPAAAITPPVIQTNSPVDNKVGKAQSVDEVLRSNPYRSVAESQRKFRTNDNNVGTHKDIDEQLRQLRDKARTDGFYDQQRATDRLLGK